MSRHLFRLKPFARSILETGYEIAGWIDRHDSCFYIHYEISGNLTAIYVPGTAQVPQRVSGLWENTCLEFFLGVKNSSRYWEFNLAPSGCWNVFRFNEYRNEKTGNRLIEEESFPSLPFSVRSSSNSLTLDLSADMEKIIEKGRKAEIGSAAVIMMNNGHVDYWAIEHGERSPDFHMRKNFTLKI